MEKIILNGYNLTLAQVKTVALGQAHVALSEEVPSKLAMARQVIEDKLQTDDLVYGVNTGFGYLKNKVISRQDIATLQRNLILSHAVGVGDLFSTDIVRAMVLLRVNALIQGHSGIRQTVIDRLLFFLNEGIHPLVPSQGSVGSSGDLAPLSHLALALIGEGEVEFQGQIQPVQAVLTSFDLDPIVLEAKEGLALINGTQPMCAVASKVLESAQHLLNLADAITAMSIQAGMGSREAFRPELHQLRPHPGQIKSADNLWRWMQESELVDSHHDCDRVQDAYSFRCSPQVHGASRQAIDHAQEVVEREINAVTDNPLVLPDTGEVISCGHFHGQPIALAMDYAGIAIAELANISERRIERLLNPHLNQGLPAFLTPKEGLNSGLMIAQYTAASLVSENKSLAHPASVDSIPTSANQEDHVSMGTIAANQALKILKNTQYVLGIELLSACQALDLRHPVKPSNAVLPLYHFVREHIPAITGDRYMAPEIELVRQWIADGVLQGCLPD